MPAAPGLAARMPCIVGRAFTPAGGPCACPEGYSQGKAPHPSVGWRRQLPLQGSLSGGGSPKKPPLQGTAELSAACGGDVPQSPAGPCPMLRRGQRRSTTAIRLPCLPPGSAARLPCIVGRAFTPAGEGSRRPERVLARQSAAPLSRLAPTAPLIGEPSGWQFSKKPPLQGEVAAPQGADGRVHCRLAAEISRKPGRALPCVS